jgi:hypothetical protein
LNDHSFFHFKIFRIEKLKIQKSAGIFFLATLKFAQINVKKLSQQYTISNEISNESLFGSLKNQKFDEDVTCTQFA